MPGVTDASPVRKSGILIGRVVTVELLDEGAALVTAEIDRDRRLFNDEVCRINRTLFGDSVLEFVKVRNWEGVKQEIDASAVLDGIVAPDPIQVVGNLEENLSNAISSVGSTSDRIGGFINKLDYLVGTDDEIRDRKDKISRIIDKTAVTAEAITRLADTANELIGDPEVREKLRASLEQMPELMQETRHAIGRMSQSMDLIDKNLNNVQEFTAILGKQGGETLIRLNQSVDKLDRLMSEVLVFSESLNNSKGTIGQARSQSRTLQQRQPRREKHRGTHPAIEADRQRCEDFLRQDRPSPGSVGRSRGHQTRRRHQEPAPRRTLAAVIYSDSPWNESQAGSVPSGLALGYGSRSRSALRWKTAKAAANPGWELSTRSCGNRIGWRRRRRSWPAQRIGRPPGGSVCCPGRG